MLAKVIRPLVRRAILDLIADVGGEMNDDVLSVLLAELGHRVARCDVVEQLEWLAARNLVIAEKQGPYTVSRSTPNGLDTAAGRLRPEGVSRHKTGE